MGNPSKLSLLKNRERTIAHKAIIVNKRNEQITKNETRSDDEDDYLIKKESDTIRNSFGLDDNSGELWNTPRASLRIAELCQWL